MGDEPTIKLQHCHGTVQTQKFKTNNIYTFNLKKKELLKMKYPYKKIF